MNTNDEQSHELDDESLLMQVIEKITTAEGFDIHDVSQAHRNVVAVITAQAVIDNGGFRHFFESQFDGSADYQMFVQAYQDVGAAESADALNQALMMFPDGVPPSEVDERQKYLNAIFDESGNDNLKISAIENKILGNMENYSLVASYIRDNRELFT